eukprot:scaffold56148_cov32-Tisochrysis_lutea.AAC.1
MPPNIGDATVSDIMAAMWSAARSVRRGFCLAVPQQQEQQHAIVWRTVCSCVRLLAAAGQGEGRGGAWTSERGGTGWGEIREGEGACRKPRGRGRAQGGVAEDGRFGKDAPN